MVIKLGSLFDGIGGFPLAGVKFGFVPVWASEIEPWPIKVTEKHFPNMKHLGDITQINGGEIEPVDVITFGSPCQDLSVAGKREVLAGERSGLFMDAVRIIRQMRTATGGKHPRFAVWENVPGAFSSNKGEDFRAVLEEITEAEIPMPRSGKWATAGMVRTSNCDIAWRTIDAQYWGVPQRRRRIFLVADFGGQCAGEILFIEEGLRGDFAESGEAREEAATDVKRSTRKTKQYLFENHSQDTRYVGPLEVSPIVSATFGMGGNNQPFVVNRAYSIQGSMIGRADKNGPQGDGVNEEVSFTLNTTDRHAVAFQPGNLSRQAGAEPSTEVFPTLGAATLGDQFPHVAYGVDCRNLYENDKLSATIQAKPNGGQSLNYQNPVRIGYTVRRLTPLECLRLQGFPDWWLDIEGMSDTQKYKAVGNSVAIPCVKFVLGGIARAMRPEG